MISTFKSNILAAVVIATMCSASQAAILDIYSEALDEGVFNAAFDAGDGVNTYGVQVIAAANSPFGTGDAIRMLDLYDQDKPELQGEFATALLEPFRIDFQSYNQSANESSSAIRFRMANTGKSISSEGRSTFSVSWQADGKISAKYQGSADDDPNDVDTTSSDPEVTGMGVQDVTLIASGPSSSYSYTLFGETRTLNPLSYDLYINGDLLNSSVDGDASHDDFKNGLAFHTIRSAADYDPSLGIQRFGLIGSSNSNVDPDYLFDNITLRTGSDIAPIPEPATSLLFMMGATGILALRRRR